MSEFRAVRMCTKLTITSLWKSMHTLFLTAESSFDGSSDLIILIDSYVVEVPETSMSSGSSNATSLYRLTNCTGSRGGRKRTLP